MASIQINKEFTMPEEELKGTLDHLATHLNEMFQVECTWKSDRCLDIRRAGANGELNITDNEVDLNVNLGIMLSPFKGRIEQAISEFINDHIY